MGEMKRGCIETGLLLVFRTNSAYDRFWESRKVPRPASASSRPSAR